MACYPFLNARNVKPAHICQVCEVYSENAMRCHRTASRLCSVMSLQAATFYEEGIQKLVPHYDKCLNGGNYVEK